jgi:nitrogen fixation/metabolism regulation signal transduction histidine kinase
LVLGGAVRMLANPVLLRMAFLFFCAMVAFGFGLIAIRRLRKNLTEEPESLAHVPMATEGLPVHAYHAVIQQLKQQKHELAAQQLSDRRKAKVSDTLSSAVLADLSSGVLFFNTSGLLRQANTAARKMLGFASPIGLSLTDVFRTASLRPSSKVAANVPSVEHALAPAMSGTTAVRGLLFNYATRDGESKVLEVTASPVMGEDASLMGTTLVLNDKTDIERIRHDQRVRQEISAELAQELRNSLAKIAGSAQQLVHSRDTELARHLADAIAAEAAELDRTIGSFLGGTHKADVMGMAAATGS